MAGDTTREIVVNRRVRRSSPIRQGPKKTQPPVAAADDAGDVRCSRLVLADDRRQDAVAALGRQARHGRSQRHARPIGSASLGWLSPVEVRRHRSQGQGRQTDARSGLGRRRSVAGRYPVQLFQARQVHDLGGQAVRRHARRRHQRRGHAGELHEAERRSRRRATSAWQSKSSMPKCR